MKLNDKGVTLVELLVVIGLFTIISAVAIVNLIKPQLQASLNSIIPQITADIKNQQLKALLGTNKQSAIAQHHGVYLSTNSYTLFSGTVYNPDDPDNFTIELKNGLEFTDITLPNSQVVFQSNTGEILNYVEGLNSFVLVNNTGQGSTYVGGEDEEPPVTVNPPVGEWKMDELSWTNDCTTNSVFDSINNNHAVACPISTGPTGGGTGKVGRAGVFDGIDDYLTIPHNNELNISGDITIATWIFPTNVTPSTQFDIVGKWDQTNTNYLLAQYGDEIRLYVNSLSNYVTTNTANLVLNTWQHVAATYDASSQTVVIYIDGVPITTTTTGSIPSSINTSTNDIHIGADIGSSTLTFVDLTISAGSDDATIDNTAFDTASTSDMIGGVSASPLVNHGQGFRFTNVPIPKGSTVTSAYVSLMKNGNDWQTVCWRLTTVDEDNTATFNAGNPPGARSITASYIANESVNASHTNNTRYNYPTTTPLQQTLGNAINSVVNRSGWNIGNALAIVNNSDQDSGACATWGRESYRMYDYSTPATNAPRLHVDYISPGAPENVYSGMIDELKVYNYPLTQQQVEVVMNDTGTSGGGEESTSIGWWKMDENIWNNNCSSSTVIDLTDYNNHGQACPQTTGPIGGVEGKIAKAGEFDGIDDYILVPYAPELNITGDLTLSAWIYPQDTSSASKFSIISKWDNNKSYQLAQYGDEIRLYLNSTSTYTTTDSANLAVDTWYHVAAVYSASKQSVFIYVNGVEQPSTVTGAIPASLNSATNNVYLGAEVGPSPSSSLDLTISSGTDDATIDSSPYNDNAVIAALGGVTPTPSTNYGQGFRFTNVQIPNGSEVTNAYLSLTKNANEWQNICWRLTAIDEDNTSTFSSISPPGSRPITSGNIAYEFISISHTDGNVYDLPTTTTPRQILAAALTSVVARPGWSSGNAIAIVNNSDQDPAACEDWGRETYRMFDYGSPTINAPKLHVDFTPPDGPSSVYKGKIDEVRIYNQELTNEEVDVIVNTTQPAAETSKGFVIFTLNKYGALQID